VPSHLGQRAAAELRRYAARTTSVSSRQIRVVPLLFAAFACGCSSVGVYRDVATNLFSGAHLGAGYTTTYSPSEASFSALMSDVNVCVEQLEAERAKFLGRDVPNPQIATLQLLQCLREKGWEIGVEGTITVS